MNGCRLSITRKFLLRSQVQGNMNLTEEGKDIWNSSGFRLTCTDPGACSLVRRAQCFQSLHSTPHGHCQVSPSSACLIPSLTTDGLRNVRCSSGLTPSGCCILCSVSLFKAQTVATRSVPVMSSALSIQLLCCHFSYTARVPCEQRWLHTSHFWPPLNDVETL